MHEHSQNINVCTYTKPIKKHEHTWAQAKRQQHKHKSKHTCTSSLAQLLPYTHARRQNRDECMLKGLKLTRNIPIVFLAKLDLTAEK